MKKVNFKESQNYALVGDVKSISDVFHRSAFHEKVFIDFLPYVLPERTGEDELDKFTTYFESQMYKSKAEKIGPCIIGIDAKGKDLKDFIKSLSSNHTQMFLSAINIITENSKLIEVNTSRLLSWFNKYGFPSGHGSKERVFAYVKDELCICSYFPLKEFNEEIKQLYFCFSLWKAALEEDKGKIVKYSKLLGYETESFKEAFYILSLKVDRKLKGITNRFEAISNYTIFYSEAEHIFNLFYYQLACYISRKDKNIGNVHMRTCKKCGEKFWASHGNDDYCGKYTGKKGCNKSANYMKKVRDSK